MRSEEELNTLKEEVETEIHELSEEELAQAAGGMSEDEFQELEVGARVLVIKGWYKNHYGTVDSFVDDKLRPHFYIAAFITLDDGTTEAFGGDEIVRA